MGFHSRFHNEHRLFHSLTKLEVETDMTTEEADIELDSIGKKKVEIWKNLELSANKTRILI